MQAIFFLIYFESQSTFMDKDKAIQDLREITNIIDKSKRYTSISGISVIAAGFIALVGTYFTLGILKDEIGSFTPAEKELLLVIIAGAILVLSLIVMFSMSAYKSHKTGEKLWNEKAKKCVSAFFYPIATGGLLSFMAYYYHFYDFIPSSQLIFYGLACIAGSPFSFKEFKVLGILCLILGITSLVHAPYNYVYWAAGFGVLNIVYGFYIHFKYEK